MLNIEARTRRGLIAKIHIAKTQLALDDDSYQSILRRVGGKTSCRDMKTLELENVVKEFTRLGFKKHPVKRAGSRKMADSLYASKIRALWLSLFHLGIVRDPSEDALTSYAKRCVKVTALQWLTPKQADNLIWSLRSWLEREGVARVHPSDAQVLQQTRCGTVSKHSPEPDDYSGMTAKIALINAQLKKLKLTPDDLLKRLSLRGIGEYVSINMIRADEYDPIIEMLGEEVRRVVR